MYLGTSGRDSLVHPTRAIQFLVGTRGKNETMAIGGPWSPSLDGPNPATDPSVLVKTAIRACKALTGIDLSNCTHWHRFLEIHYRRQETSSKPARTETTVIFMPDVWSTMPSKEEFTALQEKYAEALQDKINPKPKEPEKQPQKEPEVEVSNGKTDEPAEDKAKKDEPEDMDSKCSEDAASEKPSEEDTAMEQDGGEAEPAEAEEEEEDEEAAKPTPWRELDPKSMKVKELMAELVARGINAKGLKSQLLGRLQKSIKEEQEKEKDAPKVEEAAEENKKAEEPAAEAKEEKEAAPEEPKKAEDKPKVVDVEEEEPEVMEVQQDGTPKEKSDEDVFVKPKPIDEKQKAALTKAYTVPSKPCILVHPNTKAKSGKFDCTTMTLSVLLDYRTDDNKEGTFEVSLFAELFNEMLMRDSGFEMYKTIVEAPGKVPEPKKSKEKPKEDDKKKESEAKDDKEGSVTSTNSNEEKDTKEKV